MWRAATRMRFPPRFRHREKSLEAFVNVWKPWLDGLGAQHATAKHYADTRHAGVLFRSPLGASAAGCKREGALRIVLSLILVLFSMVTESLAQTASGPVNISGQSGTIVDGLHITNPSGDCVTIATWIGDVEAIYDRAALSTDIHRPGRRLCKRLGYHRKQHQYEAQHYS